MKKKLLVGLCLMSAGVVALWAQSGAGSGQELQGRRLFEDQTFAGNGRTCQTCHGALTGTVSPADAQKRLKQNSQDPLFRHDGSDDGLGNGVMRMLADATILITLPLPANVVMDGDATIREVTLRRGIPTTLNTPGLDPVLMLDGRAGSLEEQATGAINGHAQAPFPPSLSEVQAIARFEKTNAFFSTPELRRFFLGTGPAPGLPKGNTASEKRGKIFFDDVAPDPSKEFKPGLCGHCHSGVLLNKTSIHASAHLGGLPVPQGQSFFNVGVSTFNRAGNQLHTFVFNPGVGQTVLVSPDPGRALITGQNPPFDPTFSNADAFKIPSLRGIKNTAPYFHDNGAKTLEDVAAHYAAFFSFLTTITPQDQADIVAYMKLLD